MIAAALVLASPAATANADLARGASFPHGQLSTLSALSAAPGADDCAASVPSTAAELVWPTCFDNPAEAVALRARLRAAGVSAEIVKADRFARAVRYRPLSSYEARTQGEAARRMMPAASTGMYDVLVDWDSELRTFRWELEISCPAGWTDLGEFKLTTYVLAQEEEFADDEIAEEPCGLEGSYRGAFLYGEGVRLQGSGLSLSGEVIHWAGGDCFEVVECPLTALGSCAKSGRTVAVDPDLIPLGSEVLIEGLGVRRAEDTGGGVRGRHIDVYRGTELSFAQANTRTRVERQVCVRSPQLD